jgi:hypothetical protein
MLASLQNILDYESYYLKKNISLHGLSART